jgi:pyrimidine-nucleoside phosphorylase
LIIAKKRDRGELSRSEIASFVGGYARGEVPDYQMAALAMAIYLNGMTEAETAALVEVMLESGETLRWKKANQPAPPGHAGSGDIRPVVDKHSTGGIGDKTSLPLAPLLACCDLRVPMISGRGLGATGGTLDKLESIAGFRTNLSLDELRSIVDREGAAITGSTAELVPADKKLYALRDVTSTVASIPLITASIMSKKLAEGLDALVLDVKYGSGAFMKHLEDARRLAESMTAVGNRMGVRTSALVTDMNQPLGRMVGNGVEIDESLDVLRGGGPKDLVELTLALGAELLIATDRADDRERARHVLREQLSSGRAYERFAAMVRAQGGDLEAPRPRAPESAVAADRGGFVEAIDTESLGWAVIEMGGGRKRLEDRVDPSVGLEMTVRLGDEVRAGDRLVRLFAHEANREPVTRRIAEAVRIGDKTPARRPLIVEWIGA